MSSSSSSDASDSDSVLGEETYTGSAAASSAAPLPPALAYGKATSSKALGKAAQAAPTQTLGKWSGQFKTWDDAETHLTQKGWSPPEDDETVPDLDTAKGRKEFIAYSKRVYEALINMDNILDKAPKDGRRGNRVIKAGYPQAQFEARAMEVVKRAIDLHNDGSSLGEETDQANTEDRGLPFNKRIDEICNTLTQWKSSAVEVMDGQKILIVVNGPKASFTRKANNKRNNEEKSKKLATVPKSTPARATKPKTPKLTAAAKATRELAIKLEEEEDEAEVEFA